MNLFIQILLLLLCYTQSKSIYLERGILLNLFFINPKNKYKNNENWTLLVISLAEIININKFYLLGINLDYLLGINLDYLLGINWDYLYWWLSCIGIINIYRWKTMIIYCTLLLFPIQITYLQYIFTTLYTKNIILLLIKKKYYRLLLIFIKSAFNFDVIINRIFYKKETSFISWIYDYIPFYNDVYEYVPYYDDSSKYIDDISKYIDDSSKYIDVGSKYIDVSNKYIYVINIYSNKIINNLNNYINEKCIIEAITLLRIMFLYYYNYYVYKLDL